MFLSTQEIRDPSGERWILLQSSEVMDGRGKETSKEANGASRFLASKSLTIFEEQTLAKMIPKNSYTILQGAEVSICATHDAGGARMSQIRME